MKWFESEYENKIIKQHYRQDFDSEKKGIRNYGSFLFSRTRNNDNVEYIAILTFIRPKTSKVRIKVFNNVKVPNDRYLIIAQL
jgi:hypothetical protein